MQKQPFNIHAHTPSATCMRAGAHAHNNTTPPSLPLSPYRHSSPLPPLLQPSPSWPCHERAMWRSIPPGTSTLAVPTLPRLAAANWKDRGNRQAGRQAADSMWTFSFCASASSTLLLPKTWAAFLCDQRVKRRRIGLWHFCFLRTYKRISSAHVCQCARGWEDVCVRESLCTLFCVSVQVHSVRNVRHMSDAARCLQKIHMGTEAEFLLPWRCPSSPVIKFQLERD